MLISWKVTLSSCLIWQISAKKIIFSDHFDLGGYVNKQNCRIWGTENPHAYIEKPTHPKRVTVWFRFWIKRHNWAIFLPKWARRGRYSQWWSLAGHIQRIFVHKNWRGVKLDVLRPVFEDRIISRRTDAVWPHQSCDLTPLDYYSWGAVKAKCYADKPETIDALKDNICEIQRNTIDNVLKNWTDRVGYCTAMQSRQPFEWNYFPLFTGRIILSNEKEIWENI